MNCAIKATENGKETSWSVFSYLGDTYLFVHEYNKFYFSKRHIELTEGHHEGFSNEDDGKFWLVQIYRNIREKGI